MICALSRLGGLFLSTYGYIFGAMKWPRIGDVVLRIIQQRKTSIGGLPKPKRAEEALGYWQQTMYASRQTHSSLGVKIVASAPLSAAYNNPITPQPLENVI